jgi:hypothetical protein
VGKRDARKKKEKKKALKHRRAGSQPMLPDEGPVVFLEPRGEVKMSEVLLDFIRPYEDCWKTEEQLRKVIIMAMVAWNAAIEGGSRGQELVQSVLETLPPEAQADFLQCVAELIERKLRFFADNRRMIINYQLTMTPDGPHLLVASTLDR